jgi:ATP-binding protein involved in chromosome partitioning
MEYLAIIAGKGGVGKTTVAILLARALQQKGFKVGLLDADIYGPSIANYFQNGEHPKETEEGIIPANYSEIKNISLGYFQQKSKNISHLVRAPIANAIIDSFVHEVVWGDLDICLVDFPPGTGDVPLTLMQTLSFSGAVVVTTPEEMAKWDVEKALEMLISLKVPIYGIIQNKSFLIEGERKISLYQGEAGKELSLQFGIDFLGQMPFEPGILEKLQVKNSWYRVTSPLLLLMEEIGIEISRKIWDNRSNVWVDLRVVDENWLEASSKEGNLKRYSAFEIQQKCPCANCQRRKQKIQSQFRGLERVGNFGWKIQFSEGCSQGIYPDALFAF